MKLPVPMPCLCLVTDRRLCNSNPDDLVDAVAQAVRGGVNLVQLREKDLPGAQLLDLGKRLRKVTAGSALLFISERVDVALACDADGVQLGENGLPVEAARNVAEERLLIGRSVHSAEGAVDAEITGADFLVVGTVFPTKSHPNSQLPGTQLLFDVASRVNIPLLGIGGINVANVHEVIEAGASGAAVISSILATDDREGSARALVEAMEVTSRQAHPPFLAETGIGATHPTVHGRSG